MSKTTLERSRNKVVLGGVAVATAALASVAYASIPDAAGIIHGCYRQNSGQMRIVDTAAQCNNNEAHISWNQAGPTGPVGPVGPAGPPGPQGEPGEPATEVVALERVDGQTIIDATWPSFTPTSTGTLPPGTHVLLTNLVIDAPEHHVVCKLEVDGADVAVRSILGGPWQETLSLQGVHTNVGGGTVVVSCTKNDASAFVVVQDASVIAIPVDAVADLPP